MSHDRGWRVALLSISGVAIMILLSGMGTVVLMLRSSDIKKLDDHIEQSAAEFREDAKLIRDGFVTFEVVDEQMKQFRLDISESKMVQADMDAKVDNIVIEVTKITTHLEGHAHNL